MLFISDSKMSAHSTSYTDLLILLIQERSLQKGNYSQGTLAVAAKN